MASGGISSTGSLYVAQDPEQFNYDLDGNLLSDGRWSYTWDLARETNECQSFQGAKVADGELPAPYSHTGVISRAGENRLIAMTNNTGVGPQYGMSFAYDAKGRRIQKMV